MALYLSISPDPATLAERAAEVLEVLGGKAIETYGRFILCLAGGNTPRALYEQWAKQSSLDWGRVVLLFGDERCVPPDDPRSNYRMVAESLLATLPNQPYMLRMEGEAEDPAQAALNYDHALRELLGQQGAIHVALLGVGPDGHTASLFPGSDALREGSAFCVRTDAPASAAGGREVSRLTLTVPALRRARKLMFLAAGAEKADVLQRVVEGPLDPESMPAQFFLRDERLNVNLLMDEAAAANLSRRE